MTKPTIKIINGTEVETYKVEKSRDFYGRALRRVFARLAGWDLELTSFNGGEIEVYKYFAGDAVASYQGKLSDFAPNLDSVLRRTLSQVWREAQPSRAAFAALQLSMPEALR